MEQIQRQLRKAPGYGQADDDDDEIQVPKLDIKLIDRITQVLTEDPVFDETVYHECCNCGAAPHAAADYKSGQSSCCLCWGSDCHTRGGECRELRRRGDQDAINMAIRKRGRA